ncbi:L-type lectin family protein [Levilactobacillus enshiensis]|uniref:lectin-like domain-containing protein n=1 Tax=Levilactobacillus enshiensis TaxID=2590213 RepID=UPI001179A301|nr:hypothetical protein [Levilactobacillus enshiensis]
MLRYLVYGLMSAVMGWSLVSTDLPAWASTIEMKEDFAAAVKDAPQGIHVKTYFQSSDSYLGSPGVDEHQGTNDTDVVRVTNDVYQASAIWSKANAEVDHRFDLNHDQKLSMWLYFGNQFSRAGDGMAFVLQNDAHGAKAITQLPSMEPHQIQTETLGVWGVDDDQHQANGASLQSHVAATAIQNSWALEFDTRLNQASVTSDSETGNSFDLGTPDASLLGPHIAANYPGDPSTYYPHAVTQSWFLPTLFSASIQHDGVLPSNEGAVLMPTHRPDYGFLSNGHWHHLTLTYETASAEAPTGQMTYRFDDQEPDATGSGRSAVQNTTTIVKSKLAPGKDGLVRWGFTGATGQLAENNLVVMEQVPDLVTSTATATMTSEGHPVTEGDEVTPGTPLQLNYQLHYLRGNVDWHHIAAQIKLPTGIDFSAVTITNADGSQDRVSAPAFDTGKVSHQLGQALSKQNPRVTLSFTGKVQNKSGAVTATTSTFAGDEAIATAATPDFSVAVPRLSLKLLTPTGALVDNQQEIRLKGQVDVQHGQYRNSDLKLVSQLNDGPQVAHFLSDADAEKTFQYVLPPNTLRPGENELKLTVVAKDGLQSLPLIVTLVPIEIGDSENEGAQFVGPAGPLNFVGQLTGQAQNLMAESGFSLKIADSRPNGSWQLQAQVAPLMEKQTGRKLAGELIYQAGQDSQILTAAPKIVLTHTNKGNASVTVFGQPTGDSQQGFRLHISGAAVAGVYTGEVRWSLLNTPDTK